MSPAISNIKSKYSVNDIISVKNLINSINKEKDKVNSTRQYYERDFKLFEEKASDLSWLTNQEIHLILNMEVLFKTKLNLHFIDFALIFYLRVVLRKKSLLIYLSSLLQYV